MSFNDIFKSSYLENVTAVSLPDMALALALSFCLGLFIYFVYKKFLIMHDLHFRSFDKRAASL